ncbi:MAG TPA: M67 family metallopeptidase [Solirubrobacteraceae bacterium]|jgi:proteasome lid subunit RPN8/RPN11|nr:M67 family metallopeptidase [Solirubrobacteraceae bacterium]
MKIAAQLLDEIVAHARENSRIECCGVVAVAESGADGKRTATRVYRAENIHASALKFEIDPMELLRLNNAIDDEGWEIGAIYHSHVRSAPFPSQTDIGFAASWPGVEWIIVGLASGEQPLVRSYLIDGPDVREVAVESDGSPAGSGAGTATGAAETPS